MHGKTLNIAIFLILEIVLLCSITYGLNVKNDCLFKEEGVSFSLDKPIYIYFFIPHDWANNDDDLNYLNIKLMSTNLVLRHPLGSKKRSNEVKLEVNEMMIGWNRLFLKKRRNKVEVKIANGESRKLLQKVALQESSLDPQTFLVTGLYSLVNCLKVRPRIFYNIRANSKFRVPFILYKKANKFVAFSKANSFKFKPICSGIRQNVCNNGINSVDSFTIRKTCEDGSPSSFSRNIVNEVYVSSKAFDSTDKLNYNFTTFINLVLENDGNADFYIEMDVIPPSNAPIASLIASADGTARPKPPDTIFETATTKELISETDVASLSVDIEKNCGVNKKKSQLNRIIGGRPANPRDWLWMAAILRNNDEALVCGGVLITNRHVLTAAHCLNEYPLNELKVRLGEYDFGTAHEKDSVDFKIESFLDPNYNNRDNDIALLKLERPTSFGEFIWPVCLPPRFDTFEDRSGIVIGWGTEKVGGNTSDVLKEIKISVLKRRDCEDAFFGDPITDNMFCATSPGLDSCHGDSGGPFLIQESDSRWYVVGIVSWGKECGQINLPGVYTKVNNYLDWIQRNIRTRN